MSVDRFTVLVADGVSESGLAPLRADDRFTIVKIDDSSDPAFAEALATADGLVVRSATKVRVELLEKAPALKVVGGAGVGVDNIDLDEATQRGVAVINAPAGNTVSAAEITLAAVAVDGDVGEDVRDALLTLDEVSTAIVVRLG